MTWTSADLLTLAGSVAAATADEPELAAGMMMNRVYGGWAALGVQARTDALHDAGVAAAERLRTEQAAWPRTDPGRAGHRWARALLDALGDDGDPMPKIGHLLGVETEPWPRTSVVGYSFRDQADATGGPHDGPQVQAALLAAAEQILDEQQEPRRRGRRPGSRPGWRTGGHR